MRGPVHRQACLNLMLGMFGCVIAPVASASNCRTSREGFGTGALAMRGLLGAMQESWENLGEL
eukprot:15389798-Alexandrium_andersonii.AAC.1